MLLENPESKEGVTLDDVEDDSEEIEKALEDDEDILLVEEQEPIEL